MRVKLGVLFHVRCTSLCPFTWRTTFLCEWLTTKISKMVVVRVHAVFKVLLRGSPANDTVEELVMLRVRVFQRVTSRAQLRMFPSRCTRWPRSTAELVHRCERQRIHESSSSSGPSEAAPHRRFVRDK